MERARSYVYVCVLFALAAAAEEVKDFEIYWHINPGEKGDGEPVDYIRIDLLSFKSDMPRSKILKRNLKVKEPWRDLREFFLILV